MHEDRQKLRFYEAARSCAQPRNLLIESLENKVGKRFLWLFTTNEDYFTIVCAKMAAKDSKTKAVEGLGTI